MNIDWDKTNDETTKPMTVADVPPGHAFRTGDEDYVWIRGRGDGEEYIRCATSDDGSIRCVHPETKVTHYYPEATIVPGREVRCG